MVASGPMALTALFLLQARADLEAGARIEARVGEIPIQGTMAMLVASPNLRLAWSSGPNALQADLGARILWRPVPLLHTRPLFLETFGLSHIARPSTRSQWGLNLRASYGEQDYTSLSRQFTAQPTLPLATSMFIVAGGADGQWRVSHQTALAFRLGANHQRTLNRPSSDNSSGASTYPLPTLISVSATPALRFVLSQRSQAEFSVPVTDYDIQSSASPQVVAGGSPASGSMNVATVQPQIGLQELLTRDHRLQVGVGLTYSTIIRGTVANQGNRVAPLAQLNLDSRLHRSRDTTVSTSVGAGTTWYVDPVLGRGIWRGQAQAGLSAEMGLRWGASLRSSFATDLSKPPALAIPIDSTMFTTDASLRYRWTHVLIAELGIRYSNRAPRLGSDDFAWRGRELWAYLTLYTAMQTALTTEQTSWRPVGL